MSVTDTLAERGKTYGNFAMKALFIQRLKAQLRATPGWDNIYPDQAEALELIATKLGRILYGNPQHLDSWHDIAGYAELVAERIREEQADG